MNLSKERLFIVGLKLLDLALLILAFAGSALFIARVSGDVSSFSFLAMRFSVANFIEFSIVLLAWKWLLAMTSLYLIKEPADQKTIQADILRTVVLLLGLTFLFGKFFAIRIVTPQLLVLFGALSALLLVSARILAHYLFWRLTARRKSQQQHLLILGTNERAVKFVKRLEANPRWGYKIIGFVDESWPNIGLISNLGYPVCCDFSGLSRFLRDNAVDEVAFFLPLKSYYDLAAQMAALCEHHGIAMKYGDIFNLKMDVPTLMSWVWPPTSSRQAARGRTFQCLASASWMWRYLYHSSACSGR